MSVFVELANTTLPIDAIRRVANKAVEAGADREAVERWLRYYAEPNARIHRLAAVNAVVGGKRIWEGPWVLDTLSSCRLCGCNCRVVHTPMPELRCREGLALAALSFVGEWEIGFTERCWGAPCRGYFAAVARSRDSAIIAVMGGTSAAVPIELRRTCEP